MEIDPQKLSPCSSILLRIKIKDEETEGLQSVYLSSQVGEFKAHAAEWKANVRAEFRETRRRLSVEVHDKLQRAATIRNMERRQLGLDQRAQSLDILSHPNERRVANFNILDAATNFKTSSQESINTKLNDNVFNRFGSVSKLAKRAKNKELKKNIPGDGRKTSSEEKKEMEEEELEKEVNTSLSDLPLFVESPKSQNGFMMVPAKTKEEEEEELEEEKENKFEQFHVEMNV